MRRLIIILIVLGWAGFAGLGFIWLFQYSARASDSGLPVVLWPTESLVNRSSTQKTLLMFLHPKCSCSRASLVEFHKLTDKLAGKVQPLLVFTRPPGLEGELKDEKLTAAAKRIASATIFMDDDGHEAKRFGIKTSGHVLLFDEQGQRLFTGGITASRGHEGPSVGSVAIKNLVSEERRSFLTASIFGCSIFGDAYGR